MDKTVEELMRPRYKVIANWPGDRYFQVGQIIQFTHRGENPMSMEEHKEQWLTDFIKLPGDNGRVMYCEDFVLPYPHLFRKLEWWEDRSIDVMPMFLRDIGDGEIFKVMRWMSSDMSIIFLNQNKKMNHTGVHQASSEHFLPSTLQEYNDYIKSKELK